MSAAMFLMMAGTGLNAWSQYQQGLYASMIAKAKARLSDYKADVAKANARAIKQKSKFDQQRALKIGRRIEGKLRAKAGVSGAVISEGAPADVLAEQAAENALNVDLIGHEGLVGAAQQKNIAAQYRTEAANFMFQSKFAKATGKMAAVNAVMQGFSQMGQMGVFDTGGGQTWNQAQTAMNDPYYYNTR